jgi:hypothetical protein
VATPSLKGSWAKQRRAGKHMDALHDEITRYVEDSPHRVTGKFDRHTGFFNLTAEVLKEPDTDLWGVLLGDLIHNLRCALDHLVWQLVLLNNGTPGKQHQFPVESTGAGYWSGKPSTRERRLAGIADEHLALIDSLQPYRRAHVAEVHPLAILADLSNTDKHQFIHATTFGYDPADDSFRLLGNEDAGGMESFAWTPFPDEGEADVAWFKFRCPGPNPHVEMQGDLPVYVAFGEPGVRLQDIQGVILATGNILKTFEPFFDAHAAPPTD